MSNSVEGGLQTPTRHPLDWHSDDFWDESSLEKELERVYDICHGCRRCLSLCQSFPTLFDLIDESETLEVDGVSKSDFVKVSDQCFMCDLCFQTKCPYVPPHQFNLDFPALMLRSKAQKYKKGDTSLRDTVLASTDKVGNLLKIPVVNTVANVAMGNGAARKALQTIGSVSAEATLPKYKSRSNHKATIKSWSVIQGRPTRENTATEDTRGAVAVYWTCYGKFNDDAAISGIKSVYELNGIETAMLPKEHCCGMPKLEIGDLGAVEKAKENNIPRMAQAVRDGWDIVAPVPSCVLMFRQQFPLMFPDDPEVKLVSEAIFDPMEYLNLRHKAGLFNTDFKSSLGKVAWHVACHQRVQNFGASTKQVLELVPDTEVKAIERCSGHDGTYAVRQETHAYAVKIGRTAARLVKSYKPDLIAADCPLAGNHVASLAEVQPQSDGIQKVSPPTTKDTPKYVRAEHPISLLQRAYESTP